MTEQPHGVWIRAHYERFPATVKGALVLRGIDRDPHQVVINETRLVEVSKAAGHSIELAPAVIDVAPHVDFFVPFEFPVAELGPGWYGLECDVEIDGAPATERPGNRFSVAWPRGTTRRGSVQLGTRVGSHGGPDVHLEQVDLGADSVRLSFSADEPVDVRLVADGERLVTLEDEFDETTGRGALVTYPAMRSHMKLRIEVRVGGKPRSEPASVEVDLP